MPFHKGKKWQIWKMNPPRNFNYKELSLCESCILRKQHKIKFPKYSQTRSNDVLALIHSDICGPLNFPTYSRCQYFLTFIDDKTQYVTIYLLKHKNEMLDKFKQYKEYVETK